MTIDFSGKVALVTGAGTGIGRGSALVLARYGAAVVVAGRRMGNVEETAQLVDCQHSGLNEPVSPLLG